LLTILQLQVTNHACPLKYYADQKSTHLIRVPVLIKASTISPVNVNFHLTLIALNYSVMIRNIATFKGILQDILCIVIQLSLIGISGNVFSQPTFQRLYGTMDNDKGNSITRCSSGGYLVSGSTSNFYAGDPDLYLLRITEYGDTTWTRSYANPNIWDWGAIAAESIDHTYIVGNNCSGDVTTFSIHNYDESGNKLWTKNHDLNTETNIYSLSITHDTGIVICGNIGWPNSNVLLFRTDKTGHEIWQQSYGLDFEKSYHGLKVIQTIDQGFMICGNVKEGGYDIYKGLLIKTDSAGSEIWSREYPTTNYFQRFLTDVKQNSDSTYTIAGYDGLSVYYPDFQVFPFLMKINLNGDIIWFQSYDLAKATKSVYLSINDQYILTGASADTAVIAKTDSYGNLIWTKYIASEFSNSELISAIPAADGGYIITGSAATSSGYGGTDILIMKANENGIITEIQPPAIPFPEVEVRPNPCTEMLEVKTSCPVYSISIFDIKGTCVYESRNESDLSSDRIIQAETFPKGLLFIRCVTNKGVYSGKFIKL
jgi:hypothetical protein